MRTQPDTHCESKAAVDRFSKVPRMSSYLKFFLSSILANRLFLQKNEEIIF